jgi:hypothetical protein
MTGTKRYKVTPLAGDWVAGKRVKAGDVMELTPKAANYELILGTLEEVDPETPMEESVAPRRKRRG